MLSRPNWTAIPSTSAWGSRGKAKAVRRLVLWCFRNRETGAITVAKTPNLALTGQGNGAKKTLTLAALSMSLCAASPAYAEKPTDPQTELIVNLAVVTASVDRCHFEIDSRIIGLDLLKELMLIEDALPNGRVHYNMAVGLRVAANAVQKRRALNLFKGQSNRNADTSVLHAATFLLVQKKPVAFRGTPPSPKRRRRAAASGATAAFYTPETRADSGS
jgi:hypothetical protein